MVTHSSPSARQKTPVVLMVLGAAILFITGSFISIDWMNTLSGTASLYPAYAKPVVSILCALVAFLAVKNGLGRPDTLLMRLVFAAIVIVDISMSIYVYSSSSAITGPAFLIGAVLSILAHLLLIIRHGRGFTFLKAPKSLVYRLGFPLAFYLPVIAIFVALIPYLQRVNQFWPSLIYALLITTSLWIAWETVRHQLFPRPNALLIAGGVSFWFATELTGVIHNIEIGRISDIAMSLTWFFYMPAILLLALSAYRWQSERERERKKRR